MVVLLGDHRAEHTLGVQAVHAAGGLVLAQAPEEFSFDSLPGFNIAASAVDAVLPVAAMPAALLRHADSAAIPPEDTLPSILRMLRADTGQDLTLYRPGTLRRRLQNRILELGMDSTAYVNQLAHDRAEQEHLARDMLAHATAFFRDRPVFQALARNILPPFLAAHRGSRPLRVWVPSCGTGEEAWSLAIILREAILASGRDIKLQIMASDRDPEAIATARAALYPLAIAESVPAERLATFFERVAGGWHVRDELHGMVVFSVHDVESDPPFPSRDLIAARNVLPSPAPEPQSRTFTRLSSALAPGGLMLLGAAPWPGSPGAKAQRFETLGGAARLWRHPAHAPPPPPDPGGDQSEIRALHAELLARGAMLRVATERGRTASNDLRNIIAGGEAATVFLDAWLRIRLITPGAVVLLDLAQADIGGPLARRGNLAADVTLAQDLARAQRGEGRAEAEVELADGRWLRRHVRPYLAEDGGADGLVVTFLDITEQRASAQALEAARRDAAAAKAASHRLLAVAEQDLWPSFQALTLLHGMLERELHGTGADRLLRLQAPAIATMAGLLNTLLGRSQAPDAPLVPEPEVVTMESLFAPLAQTFHGMALAGGVTLRVVPSRRAIRTDPVLFEQMLRHLLGHALTRAAMARPPGRVLVGVRRRGEVLRVEIWESAVIPAEAGAHQREEAETLGAALRMVRRLATLLGHPLHEAPGPAPGPAFVLEATAALAPRPDPDPAASRMAAVRAPVLPRIGRILLVQPDPDERERQTRQLMSAGHQVMAAADAEAALGLVERQAMVPDLLLTLQDLPGGMDGAALCDALRERLGAALAVAVLGGEQEPALPGIARLAWPAPPQALALLVQRLLLAPGRAVEGALPLVHVVAADTTLRHALRRMLEIDGSAVQVHPTAEAFLATYRAAGGGCLVVDAALPGTSGYDLLTALRAMGDTIPAIMTTGFGDVPAAVLALRAGASDFVEKPLRGSILLAVLARAREQSRAQVIVEEQCTEATARTSKLTSRQREIMDRVLAGQPSKNIASELGISRRTVETHRAAIMRHMGAKSLPELARLALAPSQKSGKG